MAGTINAKADITVSGGVADSVKKNDYQITDADGKADEGIELEVDVTGKGYVKVTFTGVTSEGAKYTFTGLKATALSELADVELLEGEGEKTLAITPETNIVNAGTRVQLSASLSAEPAAEVNGGYKVTVEVGNQTLTAVVNSDASTSLGYVTMNSDITITADDVTVEPIIKPAYVDDTTITKWTKHALNFNMPVNIENAGLIRVKNNDAEVTGITISEGEANQVVITLPDGVNANYTMTIGAGAICDANDAKNTNEDISLKWNSTNGWVIAD